MSEVLAVPPSMRAIEREPLDAGTRIRRLNDEANRLSVALVFDERGALVGVRRVEAKPAPGSARGDSRWG